MNKKIMVIVLLLLLAGAGIGGFWWWRATKRVGAPSASVKPGTNETLGGALYKDTNPFQAAAQSNPFQASSNPLKGVYKNPFAK